MDFKEELRKYQSEIEKELAKYIRKDDCPEKVLNESIEYSLMAGGKRLRPILVLATYKLFKQDIEKCMKYAVAIELVHTWSLIHDDLPGIDNDDFRHGKLTNHKKYNEATAILAGDALLNQAYMIISNSLMNSKDEMDLNSELKVFKEFTEAIDRMIAGEYVDTEFEGKDISLEYLEYNYNNKTGALLKLCVRAGAILANAPNEDLNKLTSYAEKIGLAFQIKDDILSVEGDELITGKPVGNDEARGKCTYISKYGLDEAKTVLKNLIEDAVKIAESYGDKAEFLKELALYIMNRNK